MGSMRWGQRGSWRPEGDRRHGAEPGEQTTARLPEELIDVDDEAVLDDCRPIEERPSYRRSNRPSVRGRQNARMTPQMRVRQPRLTSQGAWQKRMTLASAIEHRVDPLGGGLNWGRVGCDRLAG